MKSNVYKFLVPILAFVLIACGGSGAIAPAATEVPATEALPATEVPATEAPIVHTIIPSAPAQNLGNASDNDETTSFEARDVNFGDDFPRNRYERPFTTEMADYLPEIDIMKFSIGDDDNFFYVTLTLGGLVNPGQAPSGHYALEVDGDIDGRGEFIVIVNPPFGSDWSVDGVQIFADENIDVGGDSPIRSDTNYAGDGYEKLVFDSGRGANPDLAWARFVDGELPAIEIAFSKTIFPETPRFMWSVWASQTGFNPAVFNLHDTTTADAAGSPDKQNSLYPIKGIAGIDNSCRVPVGFTANGSEPLGCPVAGIEQNEDVPVPPGGGPNFCDLYPILCNFTINFDFPPPPPPVP